MLWHSCRACADEIRGAKFSSGRTAASTTERPTRSVGPRGREGSLGTQKHAGACRRAPQRASPHVASGGRTLGAALHRCAKHSARARSRVTSSERSRRPHLRRGADQPAFAAELGTVIRYDSCFLTWMMSQPIAGDILIRAATTRGFVVVDAITGRHIAGPFETFSCALSAAKAKRPGSIWQQSVDHRGRRMGDPIRLPTNE